MWEQTNSTLLFFLPLSLHKLPGLFINKLLEAFLGQVVKFHVKPERLLCYRLVTYKEEVN